MRTLPALCLVAFLLTLAGNPGVGAARKPEARRDPGRAAPAQAEVPLRITADRLEADQETRLILFSGQVKAQKGETVLYCDELRVYYQPSPAAPATTAEAPRQELLGGLGGEKIDRIEARGRVRFVHEDRVATGEQAVYYQERGEIILTGNPKVWQGDNTLTGERIIVTTRENRVRVESSPQRRVEAYLYEQGDRRFLPETPGRSRKGPAPARP